MNYVDSDRVNDYINNEIEYIKSDIENNKIHNNTDK